MTSPRVVLLTADGPEHHYVARRLHAATPLSAIVIDRRPPRANWRRAWRHGLRHFASKAVRAFYLRAIGDARRREQSLAGVLGQAAAGFPPTPQVEIQGLRSEASRQAIADLEPDLLLIYGTAIVPDPILALPRDLALNMHTGISPQYRGTACAFWPIANGEPHWLGATVHECTAAVDGGRIFATSRARFEPDDDLHALFGRAVIAGAEAYVHVVQAYLDGTLEGHPQDLTLGREYRGHMRTLSPELRARRLLRQGLLRKALREGPPPAATPADHDRPKRPVTHEQSPS